MPGFGKGGVCLKNPAQLMSAAIGMPATILKPRWIRFLDMTTLEMKLCGITRVGEEGQTIILIENTIFFCGIQKHQNINTILIKFAFLIKKPQCILSMARSIITQEKNINRKKKRVKILTMFGG